MNKKMKIRNNYHKRLSCEAILGIPFAMEGKEVRVVDYDMGMNLLKNVWISEVGEEISPEVLPYMEKIVENIEIPVVKKEIPIIKTPIVENLPEIPIKKEKSIGAEKVGKVNNEIK